jgi:hypothetical protein
MSIIVTHINKNGIVHAADTNLTDKNGKHAEQASKVFAIPRHEAGLTVAGTYAVAGARMDRWLDDLTKNDKTSSLAEFVEMLRSSTEREARPEQKQSGYFFHVAGFQRGDGDRHPEFYHITNYTLTPEGNYKVDTPDKMRAGEDFWSQRESKTLKQMFENRAGFIYCNGFPSGRQIYFSLLNKMSELRSQVWNNAGWKFRPPTNISEESDILRKDMEQITLFFLQSDYSAPFIGGKIETLGLPL